MSILTIFTPTYNRGILLKQLYESLIAQTDKRFTWLIVDDGSTDNTEKIVKEFKKGILDVKYIKQKNSGKHVAFNKAIKECKSELLICVDSDDYLLKDSVERIILNYVKIKDNNEIAGMAGICIDKNHNLLGGYFPKENLLSDTMEIRDKYNLPGEPEIYKTDILKNYSFEIFENEKFITEAVLFDKLTSKFKLMYINEILMVKEYLIGGLTDNQLKIRIDNIKGTKFYYKQRIKLSKYKKAKFKASINYCRFCLHDKNLRECFVSSNKILMIFSLPFAVSIFIKDKIYINKKYK